MEPFIYPLCPYNHEISLKMGDIKGTFHNVPTLTSLPIIRYTDVEKPESRQEAIWGNESKRWLLKTIIRLN